MHRQNVGKYQNCGVEIHSHLEYANLIVSGEFAELYIRLFSLRRSIKMHPFVSIYFTPSRKFATKIDLGNYVIKKYFGPRLDKNTIRV